MMQPTKELQIITSSSGSYKEKQQIILYGKGNKKTSVGRGLSALLRSGKRY
jgi:hypothetical protein